VVTSDVNLPSTLTYIYNSIKKIFIYKQVGKWVCIKKGMC